MLVSGYCNSKAIILVNWSLSPVKASPEDWLPLTISLIWKASCHRLRWSNICNWFFCSHMISRMCLTIAFNHAFRFLNLDWSHADHWLLLGFVDFIYKIFVINEDGGNSFFSLFCKCLDWHRNSFISLKVLRIVHSSKELCLCELWRRIIILNYLEFFWVLYPSAIQRFVHGCCFSSSSWFIPSSFFRIFFIM